MKKKTLIIIMLIIGIIIGITISAIVYFNNDKSAYMLTDDGIICTRKGVVLGYQLDEDSTSYDIIIPEEFNGIKIVKIADEAFEYMNISTLEIPSSIKIIERDAFEYSKINTIKYHGTISDWCKIKLENENSSPIHLASKIYISNEEKLELLGDKVVIPGDVKKINTNTFYQWPCHIFEFAEGVETVLEHAIVTRDAFDYNEIDVILPKSIKKIEKKAIVPYYTFPEVYSYSVDINVYYAGSKDDWDNVDYIYVWLDSTKTSIIGAKIYVTTNGVYEIIK